MSFSESGGIITQSGTDTDLSGLVGNGGTLTDRNRYNEYDIGTNALRVTGTLTIASDSTKEQLITDGSTHTKVNIEVASGGVLNVGTSQADPRDYGYQDYLPAIVEEVGSLGYGETNGRDGDGSHSDRKVGLWVNGGAVNIYARSVLVGSWSTDPTNGGVLNIQYGWLGWVGSTNYAYSTDMTINNGASKFSVVSDGDYASISKFSSFIGTPYAELSDDSSTAAPYTFSDVPDLNGADLVSTGKTTGTPSVEFTNLFAGTDQQYSVLSGRNWDTELYSEFRVFTQDKDGVAITGAKIAYTGQTTTIGSVDGSGFLDVTFLMATRSAVSGAVNAYTFYTKNADTTSDVIDLVAIKYDKLIVQKTNFDLRGFGLNVADMVFFGDSLVTETDKATVDAYATINTAEQLYDRLKSYLVDNYAGETSTLVSRNGNIVEAGSYDVVIDGDFGSAFDITGNTITIKSTTFTGGINTTGTITVRDGSLLAGGTF